MTALSEAAVFEPEITRAEANDVLLGGNEVNHPNLPNKQLANRTRWLKTQVDNLSSQSSNLVVGRDVQAWDADLDALSNLRGNGVIEKFGADAYRTVPVWVDNSICQGRLSLISGAPFAANNVTNARTVYFTPINGNRIALNTGASEWVYKTFSEIGIDVALMPAHQNYDVFVFDAAGTISLEAVPWTNNLARQVGLSVRDGVLVKDGAPARRYVGTFRTSGTPGRVEDNPTHRFVYNHYNRGHREPAISTYAQAYQYNSQTFRPTGGSEVNARCLFILGIASPVRHDAQVAANGNISFRGRFDNDPADLTVDIVVRSNAPNTNSYTDSFTKVVAPGLHSVNVWESGSPSGTITYVKNTVSFSG